MKKIIEDYPNYSVTSEGSVYKNSNGRQLKMPLASRGYPRVMLQNIGQKRKSIYVHRLVALSFIPNPEGKKEVNHIDGNKLNNHFTNLEWTSCKENVRHAFKLGLIKRIGLKKPVLQLSLTGELIKEWTSATEAAVALGLNVGSHISSVAKKTGKYKSTGGFLWEYK